MTMQEAHERIEQANNEIAKLQEEIKRLQEIEDEPDIQRAGAGEPFWYIRLGDCGVNVVQCNEPIGRSCYDITETIGTRLFRNPDSFTYGEAVLMNEEELQELNDFIQEMDDDGNPVDYIVDAAYVVPLEFKETDSDETGLTDYAPTMLAVKVGDTWKADIMMTTMQAMYNAFDNGDISFSNSSNDNADDFDEEITIGDAENTEN